MALSLPGLLEEASVRNRIASSLPFHTFTCLVRASSALQELMNAPPVSADLLAPIPAGLHIKREIALQGLSAAARQHAGWAVRELLLRMACPDDNEHLRCWALDAIAEIAQPGDTWAILAVTETLRHPGMGHSRTRSNVAGLKILVKLAVRCDESLISVTVGFLLAMDKDNRTLHDSFVQLCSMVVKALEHFTSLPPGWKDEREIYAPALCDLLDEARCLQLRSCIVDALVLLSPVGEPKLIGQFVRCTRRAKTTRELVFMVSALARISKKAEHAVIDVLNFCSRDSDDNKWKNDEQALKAVSKALVKVSKAKEKSVAVFQPLRSAASAYLKV